MSAKAEGIIPFGAVSAAMLLVGVASHFTTKQPNHHVTATVVRIATAGARFPHDIVIAKAPHTMEADAAVSYPYSTTCRIGDDIDGNQTGISLAVDPNSCRRPQMSSTSRP